MRQLYLTIKKKVSERKVRDQTLQTFKDIMVLSESGVTTLDLEQFLNVRLDDYNQVFIDQYFQEYSNIYQRLNIMGLISYIVFIAEMRQNLFKSTFKKIAYPILLILTAVGSLFIFRNHLMKVLQEFVSPTLNIITETLYLLTVFLFVTCLLVGVVILALKRRKEFYILSYKFLVDIKIFELIELYQLKIITRLLIIADHDGLSTLETFQLMSQFKKEPIVSNIAYLICTDLIEGKGLDESIENMKISNHFKKLLKFSIKKDDYRNFIKAYEKHINLLFEKHIGLFAKKLYGISYVYIVILVILFYKILSLPLLMIQDI